MVIVGLIIVLENKKMNNYYRVFDPTFINYDCKNILELCNHYTSNNLWEDIYPGINLNSKRSSKDFLLTDIKLIIDSFDPSLNITYKQSQLFQMLPNQQGILHKDTDRKCGILFPITPIKNNFSPILFYDDNKNMVNEINYGNQAIIINVLKYHNVKKTNHVRINFQIDLNIKFEEVISLYNEGKLFRE